jgi:hypothetical protein
VLLPGAAQVGGQRPGEQELGVRGHEDPGPAVGLAGVADLRGGQVLSGAENAYGFGLSAALVVPMGSAGEAGW